jgi:hypothetical protein
MVDRWLSLKRDRPQGGGHPEKKPAGVTPSASSCDCRLDVRCHCVLAKPATA